MDPQNEPMANLIQRLLSRMDFLEYNLIKKHDMNMVDQMTRIDCLQAELADTVHTVGQIERENKAAKGARGLDLGGPSQLPAPSQPAQGTHESPVVTAELAAKMPSGCRERRQGHRRLRLQPVIEDLAVHLLPWHHASPFLSIRLMQSTKNKKKIRAQMHMTVSLIYVLEHNLIHL